MKDTPKVPTGKENGGRLELRVARVEFAAGALARVRVPVRVQATPGRDVLTDIDVLAVDVDQRLRVRRSVLECKSGGGQAGEPDRLFWLAGFKKYLGADRAVLVRTTASQRGVSLARRLDLHLLDERTLASREAAHAWVPDRFAHIGGDECRAAETRTDTQLKAFGEVPGALVAFMRHEALIADSNRVLGALAAFESTIDAMAVLPEPAGMTLASHALTALLLAALGDAGAAETVPDSDLRRRLERSLTTGHPEDDHILDVLAQADRFFDHELQRLHRAYSEAGSKRVDFSVRSVRDLVAEPPHWIERYIDLVERLRGNPEIACDLPQTVELACFDALLGGQAAQAPAFDHLFTPEHRSLLLATVGTLREMVGEKLAERLDGLTALSFDRRPPPLPDRRAPNNPDQTPPSAPLAQS